MTQDVPPLSPILLVRLRQNVVGAFAGRLAEVLEPLEPDTAAILDFGAVTSVDGYGINVIAETLLRGVSVYLVAVRGRVRRMFGQARAISEEQFVATVDEALQAIDRAYQPEPAPGVERRASPRVRTHIPVELVLEIEGRRVPTEGIIKDISEGGVYVELLQALDDITDEDLDYRTGMDMRFALPDVSYPCLLQGSAVHARTTAANLYCGVKFREVSYLDEDAIRIFLYRHDPDRRAGSA